MSDIQSGTLSIRGRAYRPIHADYAKALWEAQNPLLQRGEMGIEQDTRKFKIGDGVTRWNDLEYSTGPKGDTGPYFTPSVDTSGNISWTNNGGLPNPETQNIKGDNGADGVTFTPSVNAAGDISWTNDGGLPNPPTQNIKGPLGTNAPIVTTISAASTDLEVCSAKCVYNTVGIINNALNIINNGVQP